MKDGLVSLIGGGGFIGRYVAQNLLAAGARVRIVERDPRRAWFLKPLGGLGQTQFAAADVTRPDTIARAAGGSDAVVYLVGTWGPKFEAVHVDGVRAAAAAAAATGARGFVHVSALGADAESDSRYFQSKAAGEAAARAAFPDAVVLRPSVVFGSEDQFLNRFAQLLTTMSDVPIAKLMPVLKPRARFQPVHVVDVAKAVTAVLAAPAEHAGKTVELAGPEVVTMAELIRWLADATGRRPTLLELPDVVGRLLSMMPLSPISRDQWRMLGTDNVASGTLPGLSALGITPTPMEAVAPAWLVRYRKAGRFGARAAA